MKKYVIVLSMLLIASLSGCETKSMNNQVSSGLTEPTELLEPTKAPHMLQKHQ